MFNDQLATMHAESDILYSSLELGYPQGAVTLKNLDLINGENFDPAFLKNSVYFTQVNLSNSP
jgi:hypothetical protein